MISPRLLKQEILKAIKNTSNTHQKKIRFLEIPKIINFLTNSLINNNYRPSKFSCFMIKDPKIREIFAPAYEDRIVHHLVIDKIGPFIDKNLSLTLTLIEKTKAPIKPFKDYKNS